MFLPTALDSNTYDNYILPIYLYQHKYRVQFHSGISPWNLDTLQEKTAARTYYHFQCNCYHNTSHRDRTSNCSCDHPAMPSSPSRSLSCGIIPLPRVEILNQGNANNVRAHKVDIHAWMYSVHCLMYIIRVVTYVWSDSTPRDIDEYLRS